MRRAQTGVFQRLGVVAALHRAVGEIGEEGSPVGVGARARNQAHHGAAHFRFAQASGGREDDFLRVAASGHIVGDAAAALRRADRHAIDLESALAERTAVNRERDGRRSGNPADILCRGGDARHQRREAEIGAPGRNGVDDVLPQRLLRLRALHVDERSLSGDGDRLGHCPDLQIGVDRCHECTGQLDAFTPDRAESGQREGDRVRPGVERDNAVLTGSIGDGGSALLDQRRARGLDRDAWQHGAGAVTHDAGDRRLREYGVRRKTRALANTTTIVASRRICDAS